jgi:hypothetical protein
MEGAILSNANSPKTQEESISQSILPWSRDDSKARYLSYRASGFCIREALHMTGNAQSTLSLWRHDPQFAELENNIQQIAQKLRTEYTSLEFTRNFRMIMEKDYQVLKRCLNPKEELCKGDMEYLLKMRGFYTPQQLQIVESLVQGELSDVGKFSWTEAVLTMRKIEERSIKIRREDALPRVQESNGESSEHST